MKRFALTVILAFSFFGCVATSTNPSIAGYYTSRRVAETFTPVDGRDHRRTSELTLTLFDDGKYTAWHRSYYDGEWARGSALAAYDLQTNSRGSWAVVDGHLLLQSVGAADGMTDSSIKQMGRSIAPERGEASLTLKGGHWIIVWNRIEYELKDGVPNHLLDPTSPSVTPPAGAGGAPSVAADH